MTSSLTSSVENPNFDISVDENIVDLHDGDNDPHDILRNLKLKNINRLIIGQININSIRNKFDYLKKLIHQNIDIMVVTETKLDESFPSRQFFIDGYALPIRYNRKNCDGGGGSHLCQR